MKLESAVFYSNDINKIIPFYEGLGLELDYRSEDRFVSFKFSNGVKLGIKRKIEEREIPGTGTIFIEADDIEEIYNDLREKGHTFLKELTHDSFAINFSILDPDKNKIQFMKKLS